MRSRLWRQNHQQSVSFVKFSLGDSSYALPVDVVRLVVRPMPVTPLPKVSEHLEGIVKVKGVLVPVVDLRKLFGLAQAPSKRWMLLQIGERVVGVAVDTVQGVIDVLPEQLRSAPTTADEPGRPSIGSIADTDAGLVFVMDAHSLGEKLEKLVLPSTTTNGDWDEQEPDLDPAGSHP